MKMQEIKLKIYNCGYDSLNDFFKDSGLQYSTLRHWGNYREDFLNFFFKLLEDRKR